MAEQRCSEQLPLLHLLSLPFWCSGRHVLCPPSRYHGSHRPKQTFRLKNNRDDRKATGNKGNTMYQFWRSVVLCLFVSNSSIAGEPIQTSESLSLCVKVLAVHFEQHKFNQQALEAQCSCTERNLNSPLPSTTEKWFEVSKKSVTAVAVKCSQPLLIDSYKSMFSDWNHEQFGSRGVSRKMIEELTQCQAASAYQVTLDTATGELIRAKSSSKMKSLLDKCVEPILKNYR